MNLASPRLGGIDVVRMERTNLDEIDIRLVWHTPRLGAMESMVAAVVVTYGNSMLRGQAASDDRMDLASSLLLMSAMVCRSEAGA